MRKLALISSGLRSGREVAGISGSAMRKEGTKMRAKKLIVGLALTLGVMVPAAQATAQSAPVSDTLTVYDPQGNVFMSASANEANEDAATIISVPIAVDAAQFGNATDILEPDGTVSDIFGVCSCGANNALALGFASDTDTQGVNFGSFPLSSPEGNGIFDATMYLDPALRNQGYTAQFISDAAPVPEPATWAMMLLGFGAVGVALRRGRKNLPVAA